jgi:chromate transporter
MAEIVAGKGAERAALPSHGIPFAEAVRVWLRVAALSFGGPAGQIAVMHRILVDEKRWIGEGRFLHALNFCMLLPGPEAQQLTVYIGWLLHRVKGGLVAGALFVLPGFLSILALSLIYAAYGNVGVVSALFFGLKAAVLAIVLQAVIRIGGRALGNWALVAMAAAAFVAIFALGVPFPLIVLTAGVIGYIGARMGSPLFQGGGHGGKANGLADRDSVLGEGVPAHAKPPLSWTLKTTGVLLVLWLGPILILLLALGSENAFTQIAMFFAKMAVVTFGGAYAVLAYVAQEAVQHYGWLAPGEMLDGLGMAETTPGPLIMVTEFVGFMGAFRTAEGMNPYLAGVLAAFLTTWVTFVPCFLWIFLGAPYVESLRGNKALSGALTAITAAVVGVILNLAVWFAMHVIFREVGRLALGPVSLAYPIVPSLDPGALLLTLAALVAIFAAKQPVMRVIGGSAALGVAWWAVTSA